LTKMATFNPIELPSTKEKKSSSMIAVLE